MGASMLLSVEILPHTNFPESTERLIGPKVEFKGAAYLSFSQPEADFFLRLIPGAHDSVLNAA
jgi:hypothetical protein